MERLSESERTVGKATAVCNDREEEGDDQGPDPRPPQAGAILVFEVELLSTPRIAYPPPTPQPLSSIHSGKGAAHAHRNGEVL